MDVESQDTEKWVLDSEKWNSLLKYGDRSNKGKGKTVESISGNSVTKGLLLEICIP